MSKVSLPPMPYMLSLPARPLMLALLELFPMRTLLSSLPLAMDAVPMSVRFSRPEPWPSDQEDSLYTVSMPPESATMTSPADTQ